MDTPKNLSLGSLFDGIGGFPYAASFYGITPLWASEILPTAVSVTRRHFPEMEHVGDITQLHGGKLPPVDIITFGSPCQGLSSAGRRLGLADERSGLFREAIRIIREMQEATHGQYPRIALWENVPGAASTGLGGDFREVLQAFTAGEVPMPASGKWANAGMVRSRGADIAWCVYNAQHFGVPQRRRRIFLVCDFTGTSAAEILFIPKSLRGYFAAGGTPRQSASAYAESSAGAADPRTDIDTGRYHCLNGWDTQQSRVYTAEGQAPTLAGADGGGGRNPAGLVCAAFMGGQSPSSGSIAYSERVAPTLKAGNSGSNMIPQVLCAATGQANAEILKDKSATIVAGHEQPYIVRPKENEETAQPPSAYGFDLRQITSKENRTTLRQVNPSLCKTSSPHVVSVHPPVCGTLCGSGAGLSRPAGMGSEGDLCIVREVIPIHDRATQCSGGGKTRNNDGSGNGLGVGKNGDPSPTITAGDRHAVAAVDCRNLNETCDLSGTLQAKKTPGYSLNYQNPVRIHYIVRRLTPVECERLQGYPDDWTERGHDGKPISDSKRYQMLGNSIAVPCVAYIMQGIQNALLRRKDQRKQGDFDYDKTYRVHIGAME